MSYQASIPIVALPLLLGLIFPASLAFDSHPAAAFEASWVALVALELLLGAFSAYLAVFRIVVNGKTIDVRGVARRHYEISKIKRIAIVRQRYGRSACIDFDGGDRLVVGGWIARFDDLVRRVRESANPSAEFVESSF